MAATDERDVSFSEDRGLHRAKARGVGVPFTGRAPDLQPGLAERTLQSRIEEPSDEHGPSDNHAPLRRSASSSARDAAAEGWLAGRGIAPFAWNGGAYSGTDM